VTNNDDPDDNCFSNIFDCAGSCDGYWELDECGSCDPFPDNNCFQDCAGVWGGDAAEDECGVCDGSGIPEGECDCAGNVLDCAGICGGNAEDLGCGCGEPTPSGCDNVCGSIAVVDECGVCAGNGYDTCDDDNNGTSNLEQWGYGAHSVSVLDVPEDQGNQLFIEFQKSFYDTDPLSRSEVYTIELLDNDIWVSIIERFLKFNK
jgi:hypothetical protein